MRELLPGDYYLTRISGRTGIFIVLAQWMIGDLSRYSHAGVYLGNNLVAEMMPGGLEINSLSKYHGKEFVHSTFNLTVGQRRGIVESAQALVDTKYSFLGYLYVGLTYFNHCPKWIKRKVSTSRKLFCSQMVDYVYSQNGVQLFDDGRIYLDVTPGDLAKLITEK